MARQLDPNGHHPPWRRTPLLVWAASAWLSGCVFDTETSGNPALGDPAEVHDLRPAPRVGRRPAPPEADSGSQPSAAGSGPGAAGAPAQEPQADMDSGSPAEAAAPASAGADNGASAGAPAPPPASGGSGWAGAGGSADPTAAHAGEGGGVAGSAQPPAAGDQAEAGSSGSSASPDEREAKRAKPVERSEDDTLLAALIELVSSLTRGSALGGALVDLLERLTRARRLDAPLMMRVLNTLEAAGACESPETACAAACDLMRQRCGRCEREATCALVWENVCDADSARCN